MISLNYFAVFGAAVTSMIVGFLWYGPLFGKRWIALMGWTESQISEMKSNGGMMGSRGGMKKVYTLAFLGSLVMSYVLAHSLIFASAYLNTIGISAGLMVGFWNWLGFVAPLTLGSVLWEGRSWRLWFLNNSYYFISMLLMGVILSLSL